MKTFWKNNLKTINLIRYTLPPVLFGIVVFYETWEHGFSIGRPSGHMIFLFGEIIFFGVFESVAVFAILSYVYSLLTQQIANSEALESLNYTLEKKVAERTEALSQRNEELAQANVELKQLDQLKSDFVTLVNHELRGPLTTLSGGLEIALQNSTNLPGDALHIMEVMARECQKLTHFVQDTLDISRLESGNIEFTPGPVAIRPLLGRAAEVMCICRGREAVWDVPDGLPPVWADEVYLEKIINNLLSNADKYSEPSQPIEIKARAQNSHITIEVVDYGPGIPKDMQTKIFNRFERLEHGDCIKTDGWGLGLYFSKKLAELQHGELIVKSPIRVSESKPGSAFLLTMPIDSEVLEDV